MNNGYQSTSLARTMTAVAFAIVFSSTCILSAVAPAHVQAATALAGTQVSVA